MENFTLFKKAEKPIPKTASYIAGSRRSNQVLTSLDFDPITALVIQYRKLEEELERHEKIRDGQVVVLSFSSGKRLAYNAELHMSIYDKLVSIADKLLRYKYGRVPEMGDLEKRKPTPLIVQLTEEGGTYVIGDSQPDEDGDDD